MYIDNSGAIPGGLFWGMGAGSKCDGQKGKTVYYVHSQKVKKNPVDRCPMSGKVAEESGRCEFWKKLSLGQDYAEPHGQREKP